MGPKAKYRNCYLGAGVLSRTRPGQLSDTVRHGILVKSGSSLCLPSLSLKHQVSRAGRSGKAGMPSTCGWDPRLRQLSRVPDHRAPPPQLISADSQPYTQGPVFIFFTQRILMSLQFPQVHAALVTIQARIQSASDSPEGEGRCSREMKGDLFFKSEPDTMPRRTALLERWVIPSH